MEATAKRIRAIPRLEELFSRCPICDGTTNMLSGYIFCESCGQEWTVMGEPIKYEVKWHES